MSFKSRILISVLGIISAAMLVIVSGGAAQNKRTANPPTERAAEEKQFDFWIGDWDLTTKMATTTGNKEIQTFHAKNSIRFIMDGKVIQENFDGSNLPGKLKGMSVSVYNKNLRKWEQTWVDNQGSYIDVAGEFKDGKMTLSRHVKRNGKNYIARMIFENIKPDSFDWNWERSSDEGRTWQLIWRIIIHARNKSFSKQEEECPCLQPLSSQQY